MGNISATSQHTRYVADCKTAELNQTPTDVTNINQDWSPESAQEQQRMLAVAGKGVATGLLKLANSQSCKSSSSSTMEYRQSASIERPQISEDEAKTLDAAHILLQIASDGGDVNTKSLKHVRSPSSESLLSSTMQYSESAPIEILRTSNHKEAILAAAQSLREKVDTWVDPKWSEHDSNESGSDDAQSQEKAVWRKRVAGAQAITQLIMEEACKKAERDFLIYRVDGHPIGMLILVMPQPGVSGAPCIPYLVTHPGTSGGGSALLEAAATQSEEKGYHGQLELTPVDDDDYEVQKFYEAMGFDERTDLPSGETMFLEPKKSDKWKFDESKKTWQLKENADKKYVISAGFAENAGSNAGEPPRSKVRLE